MLQRFSSIASRSLWRSCVCRASVQAPLSLRAISTSLPVSPSTLPIQASFGMSVNMNMPSLITPNTMECPEANESSLEPIFAVKRTYQPSVLRRKRKFGFRVRKSSIGGRRVLKSRFLKGRKRLSL